LYKYGSIIFTRSCQCASQLIHAFISPPKSTSKQHLDRYSRFCWADDCDRQTDRQTDHATPSVTIGCIYVVLSHLRSTAMRPNTNSSRTAVVWQRERSVYLGLDETFVGQVGLVASQCNDNAGTGLSLQLFHPRLGPDKRVLIKHITAVNNTRHTPTHFDG